MESEDIMQNDTVKFLKELFGEEPRAEQEELLDILREDADKIPAQMRQEGEVQLFEHTAASLKNQRPALLAAVRKAETEPSHENIRRVIRCAVRQDDFLTALHWHQLQTKAGSMKPEDKFERYYYTLMADLQKRCQPGAQPSTGIKQMCSHSTDTARVLGDRQYLEHCVHFRVQQVRAFQDKFDAIEKTVLLPAKAKDDNASMFGALLSLAILVAGAVFLWKSYGVVAEAVDHYFIGSILFLISWLIPIFYAVAVVAADFALIWAAMVLPGLRNKKKTKQKIAQIQSQTTAALENSESYRAIRAMDKDLPLKSIFDSRTKYLSRFHSYGDRMILSALSAMTGECDLKKLRAIAEDGSTWLTRFKPIIKPKKIEDNPYHSIDELFRKDASDTELFIGFTLNRRLWAEKGLKYYNSLANDHMVYSPEAFEKLEADYDSDFIEKVLRTPFGGKHRGRNEEMILNLTERFLRDEALLAEKRSDLNQMGSTYFRLYRIFAVRNKEKAYQYGLAGVDYCEELKFDVMSHACYEENHEDYNPYLSLGYSRRDAKAYANSLSSRGDPRGKQLHEQFRKIDQMTAYRAAEARSAQARAYWEEQSRLRQEAEAAREKARAELNTRLDSIERNANLLFNGAYATQAEQIAGSSRSDTDKTLDQLRHDAFREAVIRKELDKL